MRTLAKNIYQSFEREFGARPALLIRSPGRVNLIGEHTDYNEGFVLPAAISRELILAMGPNDRSGIRLKAIDMDEKTFNSDWPVPLVKSGLSWPDYILGVIDQMTKEELEIGGFDCLFGGDLPIGAGLSSSAALEGGIVCGLSNLFGLGLDRTRMARMGQRAENDFVGMQCGIMDQFANMHGKKDCVIRLDCRSMEFEHYPFSQDAVSLLLCDTGVRRELAGSEYNIRRRQCGEGVKILREYNDSVQSLRDVTPDFIDMYRDELDPVVYRRCRFVLDENERVLMGCEDLVKGDLSSFGQRMFQSHYGLRDMYEVSCRELDILVRTAEDLPGVLGARMMGGGFGGCTINLVATAERERVAETLRTRYKKQTGKEPEMHIARIGNGTGIITPDGTA